ncbi:PQQ-dependent sugar dehydrogenase [Nocardioides sp. BP30]|uniref:PQQ-dependent sugar dehydrogenase n=1 Tax=Nocardioides sp. BP30 TaxID=3036374 RepID=UPI002468AF5D|nr:PQQ-dependent sugar dehydrogenase [Nocardioides sp. BP30]WGL50680.1 PQQ-dependent sugar dehydrogenase [Nocardioides sp. BP30]
MVRSVSSTAARNLGTAVLALTLLAAPAAACTTSDSPASASGSRPAQPATRAAVPRLSVKTLATGLDHPWDVQPLPGHRLLLTQRDRAALTLWRHGRTTNVGFDNSHIWVSGETGLLGLAVDPDFKHNRRIYTCQGWSLAGGGHDVRVVSWRLDKGYTHATLKRTLLTGLPSTSGRHGGCRLLITRNGALNVGTGDAATGTNPESLTSLGGKTLRLDRRTGKPWRTNPFRHAANGATRYITSYGHRNVQGLAQRSNGQLWSIEQGTSRDDEVNKIKEGGDYGYNPVPGYNESVPMTDDALPGKQIAAKWSSGPSTIATSGGTFVPNGRRWGALRGTLAIGVLKGEEVLFAKFTKKAGRLVSTTAPAELKRYGRIRTVVDAPNGDLLITTDNGGGDDVLLRVKPA